MDTFIMTFVVTLPCCGRSVMDGESRAFWFQPKPCRLAIWMLLALVFMVISRSLDAATYSVVDLGKFSKPPGKTENDPEAVPTGINDSGAIVGVNDVGGKYGGMLRNSDWTYLGTLGGGESFATGINGQGWVVGYSHNASINLRGFVWSSGFGDGVSGNPQMRPIGTFGGLTSEATDINDHGQVTGTAETATSNFKAFRYDQGTLTDIGTMIPELPNSFGFGINNAGHVVGAAYNEGYSAPKAFYYDGGGVTMLGDLGGKESFALSINSEDLIVGYSSLIRYGAEHAFYFKDGLMVDMGTLGGGYSYALDVNDSNMIVGGTYVDQANQQYRAFLYQDGVMMNLNELLDSSGTGWVLIEAKSINNSGQIVGIGRRNNEERGFLLNPVGSNPAFTSISVVGNDVELSFAARQSQWYRVEKQDALAATSPWMEISEEVAGNGGVATWTHVEGAGAASSFYRLKEIPAP